ncbi:MAG: hypothetical protein LC099_12090 [Anaerolineales bacterium]|nr:hypothetical protein [Anaerolineales bacterium]
MNEYKELANRIEINLSNVENAVNRALELGKKAQTSGDDDYWDGVALNLHGYYSGLEHTFEDIARTIDGNAPSGANWHAELLIQMSIDVKKIRPPVITQSTKIALDEFRGLRHIIRNVYAFYLLPSRLNELLINLPKSFKSVKKDLLDFAKFLESI